MKRLLPLLALLILSLPLTAAAQQYRVDLILFLDTTGSPAEGTVEFEPLEVARAIDPSSTSALANAGITVLPDTAFGLQEQWRRLQNSRRYKPLVKLAWIQNKPPSDRGPRLRLRWGEALSQLGADASRLQRVYTVDGSVALLLGRYLHLDADLAYATERNDGSIGLYRLTERRRMRRDELHYLDSPRLGIVARVRRAS